MKFIEFSHPEGGIAKAQAPRFSHSLPRRCQRWVWTMKDSLKTAAPAHNPLSEQWIDLRLIAGMRVVLGTCALLIVLIGPMRSSARWATPTYITLVLYSLYGLLIYHLSVRRNPLVAKKVIPWLDLLWYVPLIAFTSNTNSLFFY